MKVIREPQALLGLLEDGELAKAMRDELATTLVALNDRAGTKGKAKGSVTLKLDLEVAGGMVTIRSDLKSKRPEEERGSTVFWVTEDGGFSTQHPRQSDMFDGPREVRREAFEG